MLAKDQRSSDKAAEDLCPAVPWPDVRALGNYLRHEYDRIYPARLWAMIEDDLSQLNVAAQRALEQLRRAVD